MEKYREIMDKHKNLPIISQYQLQKQAFDFGDFRRQNCLSQNDFFALPHVALPHVMHGRIKALDKSSIGFASNLDYRLINTPAFFLYSNVWHFVWCLEIVTEYNSCKEFSII